MLQLSRQLSHQLIQQSCCHRWPSIRSIQRNIRISVQLLQTKQQNQRLSEEIKIKLKDNSNEKQNIYNNEDIGYNKVFTFPNILCMTRIAFTPIIGYLVIGEQFTIALTLCAVGSLTDLLDGYYARRYNCVTRLGAILDPLADKLLVATLTLTLTAVHLIPIWLTLLILTRDSLIITGALYLMHKRLSPPKTLSRFIAMSTEMSQQFRPTLISKVNTGFQLSLVAITLSAPVFGFTDHWFLTVLQLATGATTLSSGLNYLKRLRPSSK